MAGIGVIWVASATVMAVYPSPTPDDSGPDA